MQRKLVFFACFFTCTAAAAQQYPFVYYTPKDGLVNSRVRAIRQDSRGRMFFLTHGGLSIYDGTRFRNYNSENGLANELVNDVMEITPDSFIVATNTSRLNTIVKGKVGIFKTDDNYCPVINSLHLSNEGILYAAADEGLFILENKRFTKIPLYDASGKLPREYLERITEWGQYLLIVPWNRDGMILYEKKSREVKQVYSAIKISNVTIDPDRQLWAGTSQGLKLIDTGALKKGKIVLQELPHPFYQILRHSAVTPFFDRKRNRFFYGGGRIVRVSPNFQVDSIDVAQGLKLGTGTDLFEDREGLLWIATDGNGVVKWKGSSIQLIHSLSGKTTNITALATRGDTAWIYNNANKHIYYFSGYVSGSYHLKAQNFTVQNLYFHGKKLFLSYDNQLISISDRHDPEQYARPLMATPTGRASGGNGVIDPAGAIISLTSDNDNNYYFSVVKDGRLIHEYPVQHASDQLVIDEKGRLWAITRNNNLLLFTLHPENPNAYLQLVKDYKDQIKDPGLRCITIDKLGQVWLGTRDKGLYCLKMKGLEIDSITQFTKREGLSDNFIFNLASDVNQNIWIGAQGGLDRIFPKNGTYSIGNTGRVNDWFQTITKLAATPDGTVWALTSEGSLLKILPQTAGRHVTPPRLEFTDVTVNGEESLLPGSFSHRENNFSFSVAVPSFVDERSIQYSYRLEGSTSDKWSEPSNISTFHFINLSPGKYVLNIRCTFPEESYAPGFLSYSFIIRPPWWQSTLFRIFFVLCMIGAAVLLVRFYYKRRMQKQKAALEQQQAVERERTRIATDMHDDLGAGLSRIKFLSETIGFKKQQHLPIEEDISKIREYSHQMIDKMGEIVWALNEKNDSLNDLLSYTRAYAVEYLSQQGIRCVMDLPEQSIPVFVSGEFRRNIFLAMKEALHNIVKHAQADEVVISIETTDKLVISIKDNGSGFNKDDVRPFSNGLSNIEKRMKDIGGYSDISNEKGTTVKLVAPLPR